MGSSCCFRTLHTLLRMKLGFAELCALEVVSCTLAAVTASKPGQGEGEQMWLVFLSRQFSNFRCADVRAPQQGMRSRQALSLPHKPSRRAARRKRPRGPWYTACTPTRCQPPRALFIFCPSGLVTNRYVVLLKKEAKRLSRVIENSKHENVRLEYEASRLREDNADLLARNARLNERNLEVRRQAETLAERNRKLKSTLERELLGDVDPNLAASNRGSSKRVAASSAAVERKPVDSGAAVPSSRLTENVPSILVPTSRRRPAKTVDRGSSDRSSSSSSSRSTRRRRRPHEQSDHSDAEEIVTPRSTAPGGSLYDSREAAAARARPLKAPLGGVGNGWRNAVEGVEVAHSARRRGGSEGAPSIARLPPLRRVVDDERGGEPPMNGDSGGGSVVKREGGGMGEGEVVVNHRKGRGAPLIVGGIPPGDPDAHQRTRSRDELSRSSDGGGGGGGSSRSSSRNSRVHLSSGGRNDAGPVPPRSSEQMQPALFAHHATSAPTPEQAILPAANSASTLFSSTSSSGRKRSRLSLGGGRAADDRRLPHTAVEVTEVVEAPRQRPTGVAAAAPEVEARLSPPDPPGTLGSGSPVASPEKRVRREDCCPAAGARRRTKRSGEAESISGGARGNIVVGASRDVGGGRARAGAATGKDGRPRGEDRGYGASSDREFKQQNGGASRTAVAPSGGGEEGARWVVGVGGGGGGGADSSTMTSTPASEVTYPCLTMAVVKTSPKKKKQRGTRQQQHQQQRHHDAAKVHRSRSSSNDSRDHGRQKGGQSSRAGGGNGSRAMRQRSPPPRPSEQGDCVVEGGSSGRGLGIDAGDPEEESKYRSYEDLASAGEDRGSLRRARRDADATVDRQGPPTRSGSGGGGGGRGAVDLEDEEQAAAAAAPAVARHQQVPNPYATEAVSGGGGEGGSGERPRGEGPAVGYKFQEVRERGRAA